MSEIPKTPEGAELFDLLKRLERPPGSRTPLPPTLTAAVSSGNLAMVELFLARGSALDEKTMGSSSPLAAAATTGRLDMVELLLGKGADPNPPGLFSGPLDNAAAFGHAQVVRRLLAAGIDPKSPSAELALFRAAAAGRFDCVKILVDSGVSRDARSGARSAADMAEQMGHTEVADFLAGKPVDVGAAIARERSESERKAAASAGAFAALFEPTLAGEERQRGRPGHRGAGALCPSLRSRLRRAQCAAGAFGDSARRRGARGLSRLRPRPVVDEQALRLQARSRAMEPMSRKSRP